MSSPINNIGLTSNPQASSELGTSKKANRVGESEAREAATQFESLLIHQMLQAMRDTLPEGGLFGEGIDQEFIFDMYDQALADSIAESGGLGVKDVLLNQMIDSETDLPNAVTEKALEKYLGG